MFSELYPHEIILLAGGCILFVLAVVLVVVSAIQGKPFGKVAFLFVFAIVMIGFPSYSKIEISKDGVTLEKNVHELLQDPTNNELRSMVNAEVAKLSARPLQDPKLLTTVARAQIALGDNAAAEANVQKALQASPSQPGALELKNRIALDRNLEQLTAKVQSDPNDAGAKAQLNGAVTDASKIQVASPVTLANLARAHAVLGNDSKAKENVDKVIKINPALTPEMVFRRRATGSGRSPYP
ncbi:MAG TPA: hypothetical protein VKD70_11860 [Candidatus Acidoferrum sp.]|nr:hypothetical protein [Candidatus Acidoferrum sp.]